MTEAIVVGLGLMGAALARALHDKGHSLAVWNRSADKMEPFLDMGIQCTTDLAEAIASSKVVLVCIDNYASTRSLLGAPSVAPTLKDKVIVQLSSGSPKEAADAANWVHGLEAVYLDGAILAGPSDIGTSKAKILLSGDEEAHNRSIDLLACLGEGTVRYVGPNVRAASTLDLAWLMSRYGNFIAAIHAATICHSEGVGIDQFIELVPENPSMQRYAKVVDDESYDEFTASLRVWGEALDHIREQGRDAGINTEIPDFISGLFERAISSGLAETNVMSLIKVLQSKG